MKPHWQNGCDHPSESFLGTVIDLGSPVDVYVFEDHNHAEYCIRYGDRDHEYRSLGAALMRLDPLTAAEALAVWGMERLK